MHHVRFGRTGLKVSRLCLGTMTFESPVLNAQALRDLAERHTPKNCQCLLGPCAGWESLGAGRWPEGDMQKLGSLRATLGTAMPV